MRKPLVWIRRAAIAVGAILGAAILFTAGSIAFFAAGRRADVVDQARRVEALARGREEPASASLAADLALPDDVPLERLRMIATHNSYRKRADPLRLFFIGLAQPGEPAKLGYAHPPLSEQLDAGVRSLELDVRLRAGRFQTAHVPLVDNRSTVPDLALALEEIALWSERNPGHVPVILLLELKSDYMFLDPRLKGIGATELDLLDELLRTGLGAKLLAPDEVRGSSASLSDAIAARGWPRLAAVRGRVMVILHENEKYRRPYLAGHPSLEGRAMFTCAPEGAPDAGVAILNDPVGDAERIAVLVGRRYMVRTRADGDGEWSAAVLAAAIASGAQIVSTDHPPAYPASDGYTASFGEGRTLTTR